MHTKSAAGAGAQGGAGGDGGGGGGGGDGGGDIESDADDSEGPGMAECRYRICSWDETQALLESNQELVLATCPGEKSQVTDAAVQRNAGTTSVAHETPDDVALVARCGEITEKMLRDHFHLPLHTVAKKFGMCTTALQKLCRRFEIPTRAGRLGRSEQHQCRFCGQTSRAHECTVKRLGEQSISLCSETELQRMADAGEHIILASRAPGRARKLAFNDAELRCDNENFRFEVAFLRAQKQGDKSLDSPPKGAHTGGKAPATSFAAAGDVGGTSTPCASSYSLNLQSPARRTSP